MPYISLLVVNCRPLVFLCGPYHEENNNADRRTILRRELGNRSIDIDIEGNNVKITPFALIVDNLFQTIPDNKNICISLLEEIIAACAFKNYVFVDTLSTALELGLFSNSYSINSTTALLPSDYNIFKPTVGKFVIDTITKSGNITMCRYKNRRMNKIYNDGKSVIENLIAFRSKKLPDSIKKEIDKDFTADKNKYVLSLEFTRNVEEKGKIWFSLNNDEITFLLPAKTLFYFVNNYKEEKRIHEALFWSLLMYFQEDESFVMTLLISYRLNRIRIQVHTQFSFETSIVIGNMLLLIQMIGRQSSQKYKNLQYSQVNSTWFNPSISFCQLIGFTRKEIDKADLEFKSKRRATRRKKLIINGKTRKITMYSGTSEGYRLRELNTKICKSLENIIELHSCAFAYRKEHSALKCVKQHLNSTSFLKLDIHDFFGSISKRVLNQIIKMHLCSKKVDAYKSWKAKQLRVLNSKMNTRFRLVKVKKYRSEITDNWDGLIKATSLCFVNGKLPLGLTSSPFLSNTYMYFFDELFTREFPNLIYTRYSDDILISSNEPLQYDQLLSFIVRELSYLKLELNMSKVHHSQLKATGDHVKFLGLNIIRSNDHNYISVGKKYIAKTSKDVANLLNKNSQLSTQTIIGRIKYIKYINESDFQFLKDLFHRKTGLSQSKIDQLINI